MEVAVIGAGVAGLAAAIRVAARGDNVTLFEKNSTPGGKISQIRDKGYRFDTGPSLFTLPNLVDELLMLEGRDNANITNYPFKYFRLENSCRYFYPDGTVFDFFQDTAKLKEQIENNTDEDFDNILKRLKQSEFIYNLTSNLFIFNSFHKISNFIKKENRSIPLHLHKLGFHKSMHSANRVLFKDKRVVQLFDRYATYNGSSPYRAPATLNMISHLEHNIGAFFPEKGIYSIADSLYRKCIELGVKFEFNSLVNEILVEKKRDKRAVGVSINGSSRFFDYIICDTDVRYAAENMFSKRFKHPLAGRMSRLEPSSSALIFYWGVKGNFPELDVHNILFSADYKKEFDYLFKKRELYDDPTVYIFISKKVVPGDAPDGCENWFVMVNAPYNNGQNWQEVIAKARAVIVEKIEKRLGIANINNLIEVEHIASPVTIEKNTLSSKGALYGSSSNSMFSAFLRHPNTLRQIKNLCFTGGSTHPGGGIPLCLASAIIAEKTIYDIK